MTPGPDFGGEPCREVVVKGGMDRAQSTRGRAFGIPNGVIHPRVDIYVLASFSERALSGPTTVQVNRRIRCLPRNH